MSSLNAFQVLQILRVLSTSVLISPILQQNEVKLERLVNKPVSVLLQNSVVINAAPVLSMCVYKKGSLCSDSASVVNQMLGRRELIKSKNSKASDSV